MKPIHFLLFVSVFSSLTACTKQGPAGAPGTPGTPGAPGTPGLQGNANVQTFLFNGETFQANSETTLTVPAITQGILDSGSVNTYIGSTASNEWYNLPYAYGTTDIEVITALGEVVVIPNSPLSGSLTIKVVVIAGNE